VASIRYSIPCTHTLEQLSGQLTTAGRNTKTGTACGRTGSEPAVNAGSRYRYSATTEPMRLPRRAVEQAQTPSSPAPRCKSTPSHSRRCWCSALPRQSILRCAGRCRSCPAASKSGSPSVSCARSNSRSSCRRKARGGGKAECSIPAPTGEYPSQTIEAAWPSPDAYPGASPNLPYVH